MSLITKHFFLIVLSGFSAYVVAATDVATDKARSEIDGAKVYLDNCAICHGDAGDGNTRAKGSLRPPPRNFTTVTAALELTRQRMLDSVINGRPGTGMMPHKDRLSGKEIEVVVDYVRDNFMNFPKNKNSKQLAIIVEGERIYSKNCSVCHGDKGKTAVWAKSGLNPQPRDFTTATARKELNHKRMINSVTNGRPGTAMMPHKAKLSKKEIEQVVNYIRNSFMSGPVAVEPMQPMQQSQQSRIAAAHKNMPRSAQQMQGRPTMPGFTPPIASGGAGSANLSPMPGNSHQRQNPHGAGVPGISMPPSMEPVSSADMSVPMPKGLKGNAKKGGEFYMNNCFTCHGVKGEGNGPRAHFNTPRPRNFTSDASRRMLNRERLFKSITNGKVGTVMPAWGKVLDDQQIANIAEFVFNEFITIKNDSKKKAKKSSKKIDTKSQAKQKVSLNKKKAN